MHKSTVKINIRLRAPCCAQAFNNMELGTCLAVPYGNFDCLALAMFLLALYTSKGENFRLCIECEELHYVQNLKELASPRIFVSTSPRTEKQIIVRLVPNMQHISIYFSCSTGCITVTDGLTSHKNNWLPFLLSDTL